MAKRICVVTLSNGTDVIGELDTGHGEEWATLWRPCVMRFQPASNAQPNVQIIDLLRGGSPFLTGDHVDLNMRNVLWLGKPTKEIAAAYIRIKSGVIIPTGEPMGINQ
jgi:hypothetical protein